MNHLYESKSDVDTALDLSMYLENLLAQPEKETQSIELIETAHLDALVNTGIKEGYKETKPVNKEIPLVPDWAQQSFECLLVKLAGMNLLVPAISVKYIECMDKKITRIPLDNSAFKGVVTLRDRSIAVVDLFSLISENEQSMQVDTHHIDYVMVMEGEYYALACDKVDQLIKLECKDVRWNKASFNNPMFMGVVTEYLCPLLNIDNVYRQVEQMSFVQSLKGDRS